MIAIKECSMSDELMTRVMSGPRPKSRYQEMDIETFSIDVRKVTRWLADR